METIIGNTVTVIATGVTIAIAGKVLRFRSRICLFLFLLRVRIVVGLVTSGYTSGNSTGCLKNRILRPVYRCL